MQALPEFGYKIKELLSTEELTELSNLFKTLVIDGYPELYKENEIMEISPENLQNSLEPGHLLRTLIGEHEIMLEFISKLEQTIGNLQEINNYQDAKTEINKLLKNINYLIGAEAHNQKEENVLFPELAKRSASDILIMVKAEHDKIREYQDILKKLLFHITPMNFFDFKPKIVKTGKLFCKKLKGEINKENLILYPVALKIITDEKTWHKMKIDSSIIGCCSFILPN